MTKIQFEIVEIAADKLACKAAIAPLHIAQRYFDEYVSLISCCGWSEKDFNAELLKRIDANWHLQSKEKEN